MLTVLACATSLSLMQFFGAFNRILILTFFNYAFEFYLFK